MAVYRAATKLNRSFRVVECAPLPCGLRRLRTASWVTQSLARLVEDSAPHKEQDGEPTRQRTKHGVHTRGESSPRGAQRGRSPRAGRQLLVQCLPARILFR